MSTQNPFNDPALDPTLRAISRLREGRARREHARKIIINSLHSLSVQLECAVENGRVLDAAEIRDAMQIAVEGLKSLGGAR